MTEPTTPAGMLLHRAAAIVEGHRRDNYGQPERAFDIIAEYWTTHLRSIGVLAAGQRLQPHDVCRLMELLKIARGVGMDDCLDAAGYAALAYEVKRDAQPWTAEDEQLAREVGGTD